jgi:hypothetical protein
VWPVSRGGGGRGGVLQWPGFEADHSLSYTRRTGSYKFLKKSNCHLEILGSRLVTWSKFQTEGPQILVFTIYNLVSLRPEVCTPLLLNDVACRITKHKLHLQTSVNGRRFSAPLHLCDMRCSGILSSVWWWFLTDVSVQPVGPPLKGTANISWMLKIGRIGCPGTSLMNYRVSVQPIGSHLKGTAHISWMLKMGPIGCPETSLMNYNVSVQPIGSYPKGIAQILDYWGVDR